MREKLPQFKIKIKYNDSYLYLGNLLRDYLKSFKKYGEESLWDIATRGACEEVTKGVIRRKMKDFSLENHIERISCIFEGLQLPELLITEEPSEFSKREYIQQMFNSLIMQTSYFVLAMKEEAFKQENVSNVLSMCRRIMEMHHIPMELKKECQRALKEFIFKAFIPNLSKHYKEGLPLSTLPEDYKQEFDRIKKFFRKKLEGDKKFEDIHNRYIKLSYLQNEYPDISEDRLKEWSTMLPNNKSDFAYQVVAYKISRNRGKKVSLENIRNLCTLSKKMWRNIEGYRTQAEKNLPLPKIKNLQRPHL